MPVIPPARGPFKDFFCLNSFHKISDDRKLYSSTTVNFTGEEVIINDGFEFNDGEGDHLYEQDDYYTFYYGDIDNILAILPGEYKNESILSEYKGAEDYYHRLNKDKEKLFFLCILKCYKAGNNFDSLLKLMEENNICYKFERSKY
jgi:hypothetical protein